MEDEDGREEGVGRERLTEVVRAGVHVVGSIEALGEVLHTEKRVNNRSVLYSDEGDELKS